MKNEVILKCLFEAEKINLQYGSLLESNPAGKSSDFDFDRVEGMLLGLAVGDALGATSEGMTSSQRQDTFGEVTGYLPHPWANGRTVGLPTDDTQLAFWTLESMLDNNGLDPEKLADIFAGRRIFGIGRTVRSFIRNYKAGNYWYECGPHSAGNGALMRIAPMLVPHLRSGGSSLWTDTVLSAMITHNDEASISACTAFIGMLWELLDMQDIPDPMWWVNRYVELAAPLEGRSQYEPRGGDYGEYIGSLWGFVQEYLPRAYESGLTSRDACDGWYSGAFLLETVPSVLYILMCHADDPREAVIRAVNDTVDNDTAAAIVGAAVGALHGRKALPGEWIDGLAGRTTLDDDGRVFDLIEEAREQFWEV